MDIFNFDIVNQEMIGGLVVVSYSFHYNMLDFSYTSPKTRNINLWPFYKKSYSIPGKISDSSTGKIVINDINMKDESEKERYLKLVEDTFFSRRMYIYYKYNDKEKIKANYNRKKKNHEKINIKEKIYYYSTKNKLMKLLCKIYYILIKCLEKLCEKIKIYV